MEFKSKMSLLRITVLVCCISALYSVCGAAEYYASTTGNDTAGTGSISSPYRTIQHVLDNVAVSGDIIILRAGTYNENIRIRNSNIAIRSKSDEWAVIQSVINNEDKDIAVIFDVDSDGSALKRVEVIGGYWYGIKFNAKWDWGDPNDRSGACNIIIEDCKIHDTGQACVKITPGCDDITIRRCEIYNSGKRAPDSAEAIDNVNGDRMLVQECYIHDISATGLYAKGGATGVIIERCQVMNCGVAGILIGFDTSPEWFDTLVNPDYYENIDGIVRNCLIVNTQYSGIGMYAAKNAEIFNNTIVDAAQNGHAGLFFGITYQDWEPGAKRPPSVSPIIRNNIVVQSQSANSTAIEIRYDDELGGLSGLSGMPSMSNNCYYVKNGTAFFEDNRPGYDFSGNLAQWQSHISGDMNSIAADPMFVDTASNDYHLFSISPCIDAGTSNGAPANDYDGISRPQLNAYDMGAYEYAPYSTADGDVAPIGSRDGTVNVGDALIALRFALGLEIPTQEDMGHGDVAPLDTQNKPNPDGVITVGDALVILRKALGIVAF
ncbi:MAG: right-handed parallel beta-helix repeat-containing protein [Thermodesulfobacteriota bacterium]|nr:right-handed parallel beta-helix repeat-containing protein [Thermodesulfobacteriota bacterium]